MNKELIVNSGESGIELALLEDKNLVELHRDGNQEKIIVGDVIWASVNKLLPSLNAAFVDIGHQKNGFIHYSDLSPQIRSLLKYAKAANDGIAPYDLRGFKLEPETHKTGKITSVISKKQSILVQVTKEPISTKGHRLTAELSFPGRYMVLIPFVNYVNVSKKINNPEERKRLMRLVESIKPQNFGVIVRTNAEGKTVAELHEEMNAMMAKWKEQTLNLKGAKAPRKVLSELNKTSTILRDLLDTSFNRIVVNSREVYDDVKQYISKIAPDKESIVQLYTGKTPIFDQYDVTKQIKLSFGKTVNIEGGAYIVIEHTEALHVIDVNSGFKMNNQESQEVNALRVNLDAAKEIARQLRLRDIGGIIVVDFIDIRNPEYKKQVFTALIQAMKSDKARHSILPMSKFGLIQITRERMKPQLTIETSEQCPTCGGEGKIGPSILLMDRIHKDLQFILEKQNQKKLSLVVHPYMEGYIRFGGFLRSIQWKWFFKYKRWINVDSTDSMALVEYHFFDKDGEEIEIKQTG
ncbi:MAG: Rne/Rng family ribonuclease [Bacteroidota bacterium]